MLLSLREVSKQFGDEALFSDLSFVIDEGHKVALVGRNGSGKSTILKIIAGIEEADSGVVHLADGRSIAYLPQEIPAGEERTGVEYLTDAGFQPHQFLPILKGLKLDDAIAAQPLSGMSGGQQTKVLLAAFLLSPADILLLDEPTNNLDIPSLLWLEVFLASSKRAMVIVSHDLMFLDNVANRVFELKEGTLSCERGTYSDYIERKSKALERQRREYKVYAEKVEQLTGNIRNIRGDSDSTEGIDDAKVSDNDKLASKSKLDGASASQGRVKAIKSQLKRLDVVEKPFEEEPFTLKLNARNTENVSVEVVDAFVGYDSFRVGPVSLSLKAKSRICIMGANGAGKSTLLKTIVGAQQPLEGKVQISEAVSFGDLLQQHDRADRSKRAIEFFQSETGADREKAIYTLKNAGFEDRNLQQSVAGLSSGMRARLLFAVFVALGVNVLVLDEPTNHLDIEAVSALRDLLKTYEGAAVVVSHNRWFLEALDIDSYYRIGDGEFTRITDFEQYVTDAQKEAEGLVGRMKRMSTIAQ